MWLLIVGICGARKFREGAYLFFIVGQENFKRVPTWFLIVGRGDFEGAYKIFDYGDRTIS